MAAMAAASAVSALFPLRTVNDVTKVFAYECDKSEPDLVLLSIIAGVIENSMTTKDSGHSSHAAFATTENAVTDDNVTNANLKIEPQVEWHVVEAMHHKFESILRGFCDTSLLDKAIKADDSYQVRKLIKHVADIIWNTLSKAQYKDRPHLQSIYSYLTGNKLDCFGVAFAVVASCQMLEVPGVHLALSEDHACT